MIKLFNIDSKSDMGLMEGLPPRGLFVDIRVKEEWRTALLCPCKHCQANNVTEFSKVTKVNQLDIMSPDGSEYEEWRYKDEPQGLIIFGGILYRTNEI